jgi:hypothetical protein
MYNPEGAACCVVMGSCASRSRLKRITSAHPNKMTSGVTGRLGGLHMQSYSDACTQLDIVLHMLLPNAG